MSSLETKDCTEFYSQVAPHFVRVEQAGLATFLRYEDRDRNYDWNAPRSFAERADARFWRSIPFRHMGKFIFCASSALR